MGLAKSKDGLKWTKFNHGHPVLRHGEPGTPDSTKVDHPCVLTFDGKFHMWYTAGDRGSQYKISYATSPDGVHWTRENDGQPVLRPGKEGSFDCRVLLHPWVVRDDNGLLHMWYNGIGVQDFFLVGHATSRDGIHWKRENDGQPVLYPSQISGYDREAYVYNVSVLYKSKTFHMWYTMVTPQDYGPTMYRKRGDDQVCNAIGYAVSKDGTTWMKDNAYTVVNGRRGELDAYGSCAASVVPREDGLWMYYTMSDNGHNYRVGLIKCKGKRAE